MKSNLTHVQVIKSAEGIVEVSARWSNMNEFVINLPFEDKLKVTTHHFLQILIELNLRNVLGQVSNEDCRWCASNLMVVVLCGAISSELDLCIVVVSLLIRELVVLFKHHHV